MTMARHTVRPALSISEQLLHESLAMAQYALASGMSVPPSVVAMLELERATPGTDVPAVAKVHAQLSRLVLPATPRALLLLGPDHGANGVRAMLGSVGLVRRMMIAAVVSMVVYMAMGLTEAVNATVRTVQNSHGWVLLANEVAWLAAAAMGASFAILMQVSGYVVKRNYDPRYEPSYWIKFFLGVMAGFILVQIVPFAQISSADPNLSQLMIALVGGFSASAVFRILTRVVEAVESIFRGDAKDEIKRRESDARSRASQETSQVRMDLAAQVVRLQQAVSTGADPVALSARLRDILCTLVPDSELESDGAAAPGAASPTPAVAAVAPHGTIALPGVSVVTAPEAEPEQAPAASQSEEEEEEPEDAPTATAAASPSVSDAG
jgi:hypothetical protein